MSREEVSDLAFRFIEAADMSVIEGDAHGRQPMTDEAAAEEKRLIELDAITAAKNGFPQLTLEPSPQYGAGIIECRELLLKFCEATAR
eukprot:6508207-Alexandrium_andersonii.AAC.1